MGQVNSKFNQNKPTTERNKRRQSEPKKDYTGRLILAFFLIIVLAIIFL